MARRPALMFTGAAARIAQEAALAEALMEGDVPGCQPLSPVLVIGSSAGAINAVAANAILRHRRLHRHGADLRDAGSSAVSGHLQGRRGDLSWHDYRQLLARLDNDMVYRGGARALVHVASHVGNGFLLDSSPSARSWPKR